MRKSYDAVDITKLILAIFVVAIHTDVQGALLFGHIAVPFFFIVSAFFFFTKYVTLSKVKQNELLRKYVIRIFKLYLIWTIIYLPLNLRRLEGSAFEQVTSYARWFLTGYYPSFGPAWYLVASMIGMAVVVWLIRRIGIKLTFAAGVLIEIGMIAIISYNAVLPGVLQNVGDLIIFSPLRAIFYFAVGYLLANRVGVLAFCAKRIKTVIGVTLVSLVIMVIEQVMIEKMGLNLRLVFRAETIMIPIVAIVLTLLTLSLSIRVKYARVARELSTFIYLSHMAFVAVYKNAIHLQVDNRVMWLLVVGSCVITYAGYVFCRDKIKMPYLQLMV